MTGNQTAQQRRFDRTVWIASLAFGFFALHAARAAPPPAAPVFASSANPKVATGGEALWRRECGDCHVAYAPWLLPASAWRELMRGLDRHFGVDASLDAATTVAIAGWLERGGARGDSAAGRPVPPTPATGEAPRITTSPWFVREHREVPAATWKRPAVGRASNCAACHLEAAQGRYGEHALNIPK